MYSVGERLGLRLGISERCCELFGLFALGVERSTLVLDVGDQRVEFIGRDVARAQRNLGEFLALERIVEIVGVLEQRAERGSTATDERAQRHLAEIAPQLRQLGFLLTDTRFGVGDLGIECVLGVDRVGVLLTELQRLLLEALQFVDDVFDLLLLLIHRLRLHDCRGHGGNEERHGNGDRDDTEKLPHSYESTA